MPSLRLESDYDYSDRDPHFDPELGHRFDGGRCVFCAASPAWPLARVMCRGVRDPNMRVPGDVSIKQLYKRRAARIRELYGSGMSIEAIARRYDCTLLTVERAIERGQRKAG